MAVKKILLVDDEIIILKTIADKMRDKNFDVHTASNGEEAVGLAEANHFDLVVTDLMMEGIDGIKVLKKIKTIDPRTAVIILTGYGDLTSAIDALRLGADDYLLKPCDMEELLFRMSKCFEKQSLKEMIQVYEGILPICIDCKKIRDDTDTEPGKGDWVPIDQYLTRKAGKQMSHGYCPDCGKSFLASIDKHFEEE